MAHIWKHCWFWLSATVAACLTLLAFGWSHRVWSVTEWRVYKAMDQECHPAWQDFHYSRVQAGEPVADVIGRTRPVRIERSGRWVVLKYQSGFCFTGLTAAAYDGRMVCAYAWSCRWLRQFFDIMSEDQRKEFIHEYWDQPARIGNPIFVQ